MPYTMSGMQRGGNYGAGDYYRGDYYRGDPGLFGFLGKAVKAIGGAVVGGVKGFIQGGPIGAVTGVARQVGTQILQRAIAPPSTMRLPTLTQPVLMQAPQIGGQLQQGGLFGGVQVQSFGGTGGKTRAERAVYVDAQGNVVRKAGRRMNVANSRALRRALRRVAGFGKLAKRARRDIARAASAVGVRRGGGGSRGVITRSEAARALRK